MKKLNQNQKPLLNEVAEFNTKETIARLFENMQQEEIGSLEDLYPPVDFISKIRIERTEDRIIVVLPFDKDDDTEFCIDYTPSGERLIGQYLRKKENKK